jgi:spore photoproduct lyase
VIDVIYVEHEARKYARTKEILARFPAARVIECERHGAVFNRAGQNFRLQKNRPALMLAVKHGNTVLPAPQEYGLGGSHNYYFSHMLNCLYDCRYCFLQGIYRSANYVLYVNYEDFAASIERVTRAHSGETVWFFSGYDCDSLALDPVTGFAESFLPQFESLPHARLELRTKSTQVRVLRSRPPLANVVVAFSFTTETASDSLEHRVPDMERRIDAMAALQKQGWQIGLRFDPMIWHEDFDVGFESLCKRIFGRLDASALHSVCIGAFRLPRDFFKRMRRLYPREPLFAQRLEDRDGVVGYQRELEQSLLQEAYQRVRLYVPENLVYRMDGVQQ